MVIESPENPAKKAEQAAGIGLVWGESAQHQAEIVQIGVAHGGGGVVRGLHNLIDEVCEQVEALGGGWGGG